MRRFLAQLGAFLAIQAVIATVVVMAYRVDRSNYFGATIDKHALLDATPPGRIILVGGSNLSFGMDSPRLSAALERPVVNLSLHAALGLPFVLEEAQAVARPGDVVVVSLEYEHFQFDLTSDYLFYILEQRPQSATYLSWRSLRKLLDSAHGYVGRVVRVGYLWLIGRGEDPQVPPHARRAFNSNGDVVAHWDMPSTPEGGAIIGLSSGVPELESVVTQLNDFEDVLSQRGVKVLYTHPPLSDLAHEFAARELRELHEVLSEWCAIPVLDSPASASLPRDEFFDTAYHLRQAGARNRVDRLIPLLRDHLR